MTEAQKDGARVTRTGVIMDPISGISTYKDSTFAMLLEAQRRGHEIWYMEPSDLTIRDGVALGHMRTLSVRDNRDDWFTLGDPENLELSSLTILLMRKDPPFNMDYVYTTYVLDLAEDAGVTVVNRPQALRDANEKCFITQFPQCCVPALITRSSGEIKAFVKEQGLSVVKPLDGMGGESIFRVQPDDPNLNVILETITSKDRDLVMVQRYIPEITQGDKRILVVNGEPVPYALARIPGAGDFRGNLAKGGTGKGVPLTERDYWICEQVAPELKRRGIVFAGLDVIGDWLTEINVTSPTCIRELDSEFGLNIAGEMFDALEAQC
ncbi:MAG: glutathione synthase [Xanthomonadales bacterium]|nr:glutathione synthase [Gammaproteobacteria bacterium]MBT8054282.1 glutathione synthase [Gammaproteobacteria bacterium]NND57525.1 glutathione synthase [Xanthomonadales bacterium]NNK51249.1 glutathione synthase [Xanthomonadales bacterium]